jgi:glycine oxidase
MAARDLWPALAARAGIGLDRSGAMAVGETEWLQTVASGFASLHMRPVEIGRATAEALAPGLAAGFGRALLTREDWRVDAPAALAGLRAAAAEAGVELRRKSLNDRGDAEVLVIATGAETGLVDVAPELGLLTPIKGHIVRVAAATSGVVVRTQGVYAAPGVAMVFGATMEAGRADPDVEAGKAEPLLAAGLRLFPGLAGAPVDVAAGVRAATPDGLPMAGPSATAGVLLAAGSRRNGWLLAPLVARVLAACVTGRDPGPYAARLDPARFRG